MTPEKFREWHESRISCREAREWIATLDDQSPESVWYSCPRGDWLLWWLIQSEVWTDDLRRAVYGIADRAIRVHAVGALRDAGCNDAADALANIDPIVDPDSASAAIAAADDAADSARADSVFVAARAAARAADSAAASAAADAAHDAARDAADAADAAADSARAAAHAADNRDTERIQQADEIRAAVPFEAVLAAMTKEQS